MATESSTDTKAPGQYAEVNGIRLYYETHGAGRPLILLHGGLGSGEMFAPVLPQLARPLKSTSTPVSGGRSAKRP